ncbi:MAG: hypothetical protein GY749_06095 [Desulfobacteraceae bacterium]|nr:hypothetical protein [Desulfobacteraceae bacterium]
MALDGQGKWGIVFIMFSLLYLLYPSNAYLSFINSIMKSIMILSYLSLTASIRDNYHPAQSIIKSTKASDDLKTSLKAFGFLLLGGYLFITLLYIIARLGLWLSNLSHLPFVPVINVLIIIFISLFVYFLIMKKELIILFASCVGLVMTYIWILYVIEWLFSKNWGMVGVYIAYAIAIIILLITVVFFIIVLKRVSHLLSILWRKKMYPPNSFTIEIWKDRISQANESQQTDLLLRTNHQIIGLTPEAFLELLYDIQSLLKKEPALSAYWEKRNQLEEILKQERQG